MKEELEEESGFRWCPSCPTGAPAPAPAEVRVPPDEDGVEDCDDGNDLDNDDCLSDCVAASCGERYISTLLGEKARLEMAAATAS